MLVNSTNTPLTDDDFPVITLCNVNLVSLYARYKNKLFSFLKVEAYTPYVFLSTFRKVFPNHVTRTFESSKEVNIYFYFTYLGNQLVSFFASVGSAMQQHDQGMLLQEGKVSPVFYYANWVSPEKYFI